jgi:hypothetical protein
MRAVPDVAMAAANHDGYFIAENGSYYIMSGTSAAAPTFAAIMSLVVESKGGTGQGSANAELYSLIDAEPSPFHSTPSGNNSVPGVAGFTATGAPYNLATGLGSVNGALLVSSWEENSVSTTPSSDFTIGLASGASSSPTALPGGTASATFVVIPADGSVFPDAVSLSASGLPQGAVAVFSPAGIAPGSGSTTVKLTIQLAQLSVAAASAVGIAGRLAPLSLVLLLLPFFGKPRRAGRRLSRLVSVLLLAIAGMAAMAGLSNCGSMTSAADQSPQSYTVTVTASSGALSHSTTITLTVE